MHQIFVTAATEPLQCVSIYDGVKSETLAVKKTRILQVVDSLIIQ